MIGDSVILYNRNEVSVLAQALQDNISSLKRLTELGKKGRKAVFDKFNIKQTAELFIRILNKRIKNFNR
jgi:hypothetical protein